MVELRAAVSYPGMGRALTVYQQVYPQAQLGSGKIEHALLDQLQRWLGGRSRVIVVTDAGFRRPWFAHVERLGWDWVGRVRRGVLLAAPGPSCSSPGAGRRWAAGLHAPTGVPGASATVG